MKNKVRVAIQGIAGCFHDAAVREYFHDYDVEIVECCSFEELFERLRYEASMVGIVAIENTIAGSLLPNHELLRQSDVRIIGEHRKRITHVLAALPGQSIQDIKEVNSHPMALRQCDNFLHRLNGVRKTESFDTAGAAREIAQKQLLGHAAICPKLAASLYGLNILEEGIETNKRNFTRFLIVADPILASEIGPGEREVNKASVVFTLPHNKGALSRVLSILSFYDINLTKIQSMPIIGREWEYRFYLDVTFDSTVRYHQAIDAIRPLINDFKTLGLYCESATELSHD
jgi:prephenate dehydratase